MISVHVFISGKVQGVGYRQSTVQTAQRLGIKGWVRNLLDGRVEAVFEGDKSAVEQIVKWCHQGPRSAVVEDVNTETIDPQFFEDFSVKKTQ